MAVVDTREINRSFKTDRGVSTGTRSFIVRVDSTDDDAETVHDDATLPAIGDPYKTGSNATAISKAVVGGGQDELDQFHYRADVGYSTRKDDQDASISNPLNRPTEYGWGGSNREEPYFRDEDGNPVVNSAGEQFQSLPSREIDRGTIQVTRNESSYDDGTLETFINTYNSGAVTIDGESYAAGELRMRNISATGPEEENGVTFYRITYDIQKNPNGWDTEKFEDRGLNELANAGADLTPILDNDGEPVTMPWPLDGAGAAKPNPDDTPAELTFKPYAGKSWTSLSFT